MGPQGHHRGLPRRSSYARPRAASLLGVQEFVLSQQRDVHQSRVGCVKDSAVLSPASPAIPTSYQIINKPIVHVGTLYHLLSIVKFFSHGEVFTL